MLIIGISAVIAFIVVIICFIKFEKLDNNSNVLNFFWSIIIGGFTFLTICLILFGCTSSLAPVSEIKDYPIYNQGTSAYYLNDENEIILLDSDKNGYKIEASDQVNEPTVHIVKYNYSIYFRSDAISVVLPSNDYKE